MKTSNIEIMGKIKNYILSELSVKQNSNGTWSVVHTTGAKLTYNQTIGDYKKGQNQFSIFKATNILNHLTDLDYKDCIDLVDTH